MGRPAVVGLAGADEPYFRRVDWPLPSERSRAPVARYRGAAQPRGDRVLLRRRDAAWEPSSGGLVVVPGGLERRAGRRAQAGGKLVSKDETQWAEVVAVGPDVRGLAPGDRVVVASNRFPEGQALGSTVWNLEQDPGGVTYEFFLRQDGVVAVVEREEYVGVDLSLEG